MTRFFAFLTCLLTCAGFAASADERITVFAAASLRGVLEDFAGLPGAPAMSLSFAGSGTIARQVAAGAPADVVMLASPQWMDWLAAQGIVTETAVRQVATNRLVLIGPSGAAPLGGPADIVPRLGTGRLAMGQREAVPAGSYARQWLQNAGVWDDVEDRLAETDNVRAALALVARGDAPLGVVYASDALEEPAVAVLWEVPQDSHDPILYPAAALTPSGKSLLEALAGPEAAAIFERHGFGSVDP